VAQAPPELAAANRFLCAALSRAAHLPEGLASAIHFAHSNSPTQQPDFHPLLFSMHRWRGRVSGLAPTGTSAGQPTPTCRALSTR